MARYIIGLFLALGLIIVVVVLIIHVLTGGSASSPKPFDLKSYGSSDIKVRYTIDTPVTDPESHHDVIITVGNDQTTLQVTKGYDGSMTNLNNTPMTVSAYTVFLHALALNGFDKGNNSKALADERGQCALGDRYIMEVIDNNGNDLKRYWHSSCGNGTFEGNFAAVNQLFIKQVPNFYTLTNNVTY